MASAQPVGDWAVYALLAIRITVELLLWLAVLKRQSIIATVIIGAQMVGRMLGVPAGIRVILDGHYQALIYLGGVACLSIALVSLLAPSARQWFVKKGRAVQSDAQKFS